MNTPVHIAERNHPRLGKEKMLLQPDSALPDGHEGDAEEEAEDAAHLGHHGGGGVKELLLLHRGVPATKQITVNFLFHLELATREKMTWVDLKEVGNAPPRNLYSR